MDVTRRVFAKCIGAAAALIGVPSSGALLYREDDQLVVPPRNDWIEDRGDHYVVNVPDFKMLQREFFDKPTIFLLGTESVLADVHVEGFVNIRMGTHSQFRDSRIDARNFRTTVNRPTVLLGAPTATKGPVVFSRLNVLSAPQAESCIAVQSY